MIEHEGTIHNINGNRYTIRITQSSACSECHAKDVCMAADTKVKMVDVIDTTGEFEIHDRVLLTGKTSIGYKAILWAFLVPLTILIAVIIVATSIWDMDELQAAVLALVSLAPYYLLLYILKDRMRKKLAFTIKRIKRG